MSTPTPTRPSESAASLNAAADASRAARNVPEATPTKPAPATKPATKPAARKPATKPAPARSGARKPAPAPAPVGRAALSPRERASRPPTATIAAYVDFLAANVFTGKPGTLPSGTPFGKLSPREREIAALSITLYGAYQSSPARRAARGL